METVKCVGFEEIHALFMHVFLTKTKSLRKNLEKTEKCNVDKQCSIFPYFDKWIARKCYIHYCVDFEFNNLLNPQFRIHETDILKDDENDLKGSQFYALSKLSASWLILKDDLFQGCENSQFHRQ